MTESVNRPLLQFLQCSVQKTTLLLVMSLMLVSCDGELTSAAQLNIATEQDVTVNRLLAAQCAQCHGTDGKAVGNMEELAGESAKDLYEDMIDMRAEDRPENIMDHQALGYTEEQILRISRYYGALSDDDDKDD